VRILTLPQIQQSFVYSEVVDRMREALIAHSRGETETPMPMHLDIAPECAEVHMKSSYRRGGAYFALKVAGTFPGNSARNLSTSSGMMLLSSAETGEPVAFLADSGHLTDVRTAAVSAMAARELGRTDSTLGILGTGVQARLQARMHAEVLALTRVVLWGRSTARAAECCADLQAALPNTEVVAVRTPAEVARQARLIVTVTPSREPLLRLADLQAGTLLSAVGSDSPHKQELDPDILRRAVLLLADSRRQCEKLGELQHAPAEWSRVVELGAFCQSPPDWDRNGIVVCDFTGLGVEDLYIAEYCLRSFLENRTV
jgi:ornithine cyclodeaminase/alanine dehydrogenase-like protein (mu-crystallin family)